MKAKKRKRLIKTVESEVAKAQNHLRNAAEVADELGCVRSQLEFESAADELASDQSVFRSDVEKAR